MNTKFRYKFCPQLETYDKLLNYWKPYVMFKQPNNIKNNVFNTDDFGMRLTDNEKEKGSYSLYGTGIEEENKQQIAVVGGSSAFGVGSSNDSKTISSSLAAKTNYKVYNLGFRAYNNFQELIMFQQVFHKFKNLKYVIFFSGFNDIFLSKYINNFDENSAPYYFESEFNHRMNYPLNSRLKALLYNILPNALSKKINWNTDDKNKIIDKLINRGPKTSKLIDKKNKAEYDWKKNYLNNLNIWKVMSEHFNFKIIFALQPFIKWTNKEITDEERLIYEELNVNNSKKVIKTLLSMQKEEYEDAASFFKEVCNKHKFNFFDTNQLINNKAYRDKWFFVDSVHLNDYGYTEIAQNLAKIIND